MTQPYKQCPQCRTPAALQAQVCTSCGRQYRTQFVPPSPINQTQMVIPGAPPPVNHTAILDEMTRQYKQLRIWELVCFFWFFWSIIGLFIAFYFSSRLDAIRTTVAKTGVHVNDWEGPLLRWYWGTLAKFAAASASVFIGIPLLIYLSVSFSGAMTPKTPHPQESAPAETQPVSSGSEQPSVRVTWSDYHLRSYVPGLVVNLTDRPLSNIRAGVWTRDHKDGKLHLYGAIVNPGLQAMGTPETDTFNLPPHGEQAVTFYLDGNEFSGATQVIDSSRAEIKSESRVIDMSGRSSP